MSSFFSYSENLLLLVSLLCTDSNAFFPLLDASVLSRAALKSKGDCVVKLAAKVSACMTTKGWVETMVEATATIRLIGGSTGSSDMRRPKEVKDEEEEEEEDVVEEDEEDEDDPISARISFRTPPPPLLPLLPSSSLDGVSRPRAVLILAKRGEGEELMPGDDNDDGDDDIDDDDDDADDEVLVVVVVAVVARAASV